MKTFVWVGYSKEPPYLPVAVAETASELARRMGTSENTVTASWCKYRSGKWPSCRFHKVRVST